MTTPTPPIPSGDLDRLDRHRINRLLWEKDLTDDEIARRLRVRHHELLRSRLGRVTRSEHHEGIAQVFGVDPSELLFVGPLLVDDARTEAIDIRSDANRIRAPRCAIEALDWIHELDPISHRVLGAVALAVVLAPILQRWPKEGDHMALVRPWLSAAEATPEALLPVELAARVATGSSPEAARIAREALAEGLQLTPIPIAELKKRDRPGGAWRSKPVPDTRSRVPWFAAHVFDPKLHQLEDFGAAFERMMGMTGCEMYGYNPIARTARGLLDVAAGMRREGADLRAPVERGMDEFTARVFLGKDPKRRAQQIAENHERQRRIHVNIHMQSVLAWWRAPDEDSILDEPDRRSRNREVVLAGLDEDVRSERPPEHGNWGPWKVWRLWTETGGAPPTAERDAAAQALVPVYFVRIRLGMGRIQEDLDDLETCARRALAMAPEALAAGWSPAEFGLRVVGAQDPDLLEVALEEMRNPNKGDRSFRPLDKLDDLAMSRRKPAVRSAKASAPKKARKAG